MSHLTLINLIFFVLFSLSGQLCAQNVKAFVEDETGNPIPYATIYHSGRKTGTISAVNGAFSIELSPEADTSRIFLSCLGYKPLSLTEDEFKKMVKAGVSIVLKETSYDLETTEVTSEKINLRRDILQLKPPLNATYGFLTNPDRKPIEQGTIYTPKTECHIDEVLLEVKEMDADSILLDVNLYDHHAGRVGEPLLKKRIYLALTQDEIGREVRVPLTDQNIITNRSFLVSLRVLKVSGEQGEFSFSAKTRRKIGQRRVFGGKWKDSYISPAFKVGVSYLKKKG